MCLLTTFSGPDSGGMVEANAPPGPALAFVDSINQDPGVASRAHAGAALSRELVMNFESSKSENPYGH